MLNPPNSAEKNRSAHGFIHNKTRKKDRAHKLKFIYLLCNLRLQLRDKISDEIDTWFGRDAVYENLDEFDESDGQSIIEVNDDFDDFGEVFDIGDKDEAEV